MKKVFFKMTAVVMAVVILCCFSGCKSQYSKVLLTMNGISEDTTNFAKDAECKILSGGKEKDASKAIDGDLDTAVKSASKTGEIILDFGSEKTFNTVVLTEKGWNIQNFHFYRLENINEDGTENWKEFYRQDRIEDIRYCNFDPVTTSKLCIAVDQSNESFKISEIQVMNVSLAEKDNFDVTAYVRPKMVLEFYQNKDNPNANHLFDKESFDVVTQVIVFGWFSYNENGEIVFTHDTATEDEWKQAFDYFREFCGKDIKMIQTIMVGSDPDSCFGPKMKETVSNTVSFLKKWNLDGVNYDWEFPKGKQYDMFSDFLVELKSAMDNRILSCAWYSWGINLSDEAIKVQDQIYIMGYDTYDQQGNNNAFLGGCVQNIEYFIDKGVAPENLQIGISMYARPADASEVWVDYDLMERESGYFDNYYVDPVSGTRMYYNGPQCMRDKTAYASARGIGGIMLYHLTEDIPYEDENSLVRAVQSALNPPTEYNGGLKFETKN